MKPSMHYQEDDSGIHIFRFETSNAANVSAMFAQLEVIYREQDRDRPVLILSDTTQSGTLPIGRVGHGVRALYAGHEKGRFDHTAVAFVVKNRFLVDTFISMLRSIRSEIHANVFDADDSAAARAWLLEQFPAEL